MERLPGPEHDEPEGARLKQWMYWVSLYVAYPLEISIEVFLLVVHGQWNALLALAAFALLQMISSQTTLDVRIAFQRRWLYKARALFLRGRSLSSDFDLDIWEKRKGWRSILYVFAPGAALIFLSDAKHGNLLFASKHLRMTWYLWSAYQLDERKDFAHFALCATVEQVAMLALFSYQQVFRRALFTRIFIAALMYENFDDILVQCLPLILWSGEFSMALNMFVLFILPFEVFGVRSLLSLRLLKPERFNIANAQARSPSRSPRNSSLGPPIASPFFETKGSPGESNSFASQYLLLTLICIPMGTMCFSYGNTIPIGENARWFSIFRFMQAAFFASLTVVTFLLRQAVDFTFHPTIAQTHVSVSPQISRETYMAWGATVCVALLSGDMAASGTVMAMGAIFFLPMVTQKWKISRRTQRRLVFLIQTILLVSQYLQSGIQQRGKSSSQGWESSSILLALIRATLVFDDSSKLSDILVDVCTVSTIHLLFVALAQHSSATLMDTDVGTMASMSLISACTLVVAVANACSAESQARLYQIIHRSENFLDHAIKQKYSAVGAALEAVLESFPSSDSFAACESHHTASEKDELGISKQEFSLRPLHELLSRALQECHMGRDICHMSAVVRKSALTGGFINDRGELWTTNQTTLTFSSLLSDWRRMRLFRSVDIVETAKPFVDRATLLTDTDLLRALLASHCQTDPSMFILRISLALEGERLLPLDGFAIKLALLQSSGPRSQLKTSNANYLPTVNAGSPFSFHSHAAKPYMSRLQSGVARLLNVSLVRGKPALIIYFDSKGEQCGDPHGTSSPQVKPVRLMSASASSESEFRISETEFPSSAVPTAASTPRNLPQVPPNLTFAILDDNVLVRTNLLRLAIHHLGANTRLSFAAGATLEEALFFPHDITARGVDVAIFDENLDYEPSSTNPQSPSRTSGSNLAEIARLRGFKGCAILHSANGDLAHSLDRSVFDGFVEKTSKRQEFISAMARIWSDFNRKSSAQSQRK